MVKSIAEGKIKISESLNVKCNACFTKIIVAAQKIDLNKVTKQMLLNKMFV